MEFVSIKRLRGVSKMAKSQKGGGDAAEFVMATQAAYFDKTPSVNQWLGKFS